MPKNTPTRIIDSQKARAVAFLGGSGSAGGGVSDHGLLNGLADDDHAQYLRTDGARTLTGNLAVDASVTIDGVDISAHAANANAHHNQAHVITGSDHTVTGSTYQIVGLTGTNTIGLLTPASSPGANAIVKTDGSSSVTLVDLTVTSDLFMTGTLDFGTDTMYEDASYLQVAGSKAVRFAQNIGNANWTVFNAGGASFGGSVDIVGSGDLYVAGSLGGAGGVLKTSGNRVGIACVPDSQFALDVAGPARAQYWIGPHALQIPDALMICHYDGSTPYNTNYNGIALGHMGQIGTSTGGVIYRPGKFGKALQVADATTNLFWDSSCEYDASLTLWGTTVTGGSLTKSRSTEVPALYGSYVAKLVQSSSGTGTFYQGMAPAAGTIGLSCYVRKADKSAVTSSDCTLYFGTNLTTTYTSVGGGWYRLTASVSASGATYSAGLNVKTSKTVYADGFQAEATIITPYADGTLGSGYAWSGTAYQSSSTRTSGTMAYTLSTISTDSPSTIMAWVNLDTATSKNYHYLWYVASDSYSAYINSSRTLFIGTINCGTLPAGWVHVALTHDGGGGIWVYVNGAQIGSTTITRAALSTFNVGGHSSGLCSNGLIDDFAIIGRLLPEDEILSIYNSNAPVFAESSTVSWVATPSGLVWADERGLWMRDTAGNSVLGVYGGEAATYSWAGFTMASGDLVLGRNAVGSSAIWWDQSAGKFGFYGAGSGTPQVEIATDGSMTAGAGKVKLDSTGFHAYNAASTECLLVDSQGLFTSLAGGARTSIRSTTEGSRLRLFYNEIYSADAEAYTDNLSVSRAMYPLVIRSVRGAGTGSYAAFIEMAATDSDGSPAAKIIMAEGTYIPTYSEGGGWNTTRVIDMQAHTIALQASVLRLVDLTTSAAAVGTYAGKIKVNIAGTDRYIPYYAS